MPLSEFIFDFLENNNYLCHFLISFLALIGSFYLVFYTLLAGFFSGMLYVSQQMLDDDKPSMNMYDNGGKHPMLNQPGQLSNFQLF